MENQTTKLNRIVKISIFILVIVLFAFVLSGCKKADVQINNSENQTDIEELSNKVDELQKFKDEQQEKEALAKQQEEEAIKQAEIDKCESLKKSCELKVKNYNERITEYSKPYTSDCVKNYEYQIKHPTGPNPEAYVENSLKPGLKACKKSIADKNNEIDANRKEYQEKLSGLLNGECKNYKNPC